MPLLLLGSLVVLGGLVLLLGSLVLLVVCSGINNLFADHEQPDAGAEVSFYHDAQCALLRGRGVCNCDPEMRVHEVVPPGTDT